MLQGKTSTTKITNAEQQDSADREAPVVEEINDINDPRFVRNKLNELFESKAVEIYDDAGNPQSAGASVKVDDVPTDFILVAAPALIYNQISSIHSHMWNLPIYSVLS